MPGLARQVQDPFLVLRLRIADDPAQIRQCLVKIANPAQQFADQIGQRDFAQIAADRHFFLQECRLVGVDRFLQHVLLFGEHFFFAVQPGQAQRQAGHMAGRQGYHIGVMNRQFMRGHGLVPRAIAAEIEVDLPSGQELLQLFALRLQQREKAVFVRGEPAVRAQPDRIIIGVEVVVMCAKISIRLDRNHLPARFRHGECFFTNRAGFFHLI